MVDVALTVNTLADETTADNTLSLREAINVINSGSTAGLSRAEQAQVSGTLGQNDTIQFAASLAGATITLTNGQLTITRDVTIAGPGASQLTISGNAASRIFNISGSATVSTNLDVPSNAETGASTLVLIANGIPSSPVSISVN